MHQRIICNGNSWPTRTIPQIGAFHPQAKRCSTFSKNTPEWVCLNFYQYEDSRHIGLRHRRYFVISSCLTQSNLIFVEKGNNMGFSPFLVAILASSRWKITLLLCLLNLYVDISKYLYVDKQNAKMKISWVGPFLPAVGDHLQLRNVISSCTVDCARLHTLATPSGLFLT